MSLPPLNSAQERAVQAPSKPLLIVAGAGTGKTRTLTSRLIYLIEDGVPPDRIAALTFTNKAAEEMAERVELGIMNYELRENETTSSSIIHNSRFAIHSKRPFIGTFHSLGARTLRHEARSFGRTQDFVIYDTDDSRALLRKIMKADGIPARGRIGVAFFESKISGVKNGSLDVRGLESSDRSEYRLAANVFKKYEDALETSNAFDFDDLIEKPVRLFRENAVILKAYQRRMTHILVDEYQDVNNVQYEFLRLLVGTAGNVSVVGDDAQSIYKWRGANFEIFLNFEKHWEGAEVVLLEENYRSTGNIIGAASGLIKENRRQKQKKLWTKNPAGKPVRVVEFADEDTEAAWIVGEIEKSKIKNQNEGIAILYRTNAQSRPLEQALIERDIPYRIFGGVKFYERKEVRDVLAALRCVSNPKDAISRERLETAISKGRFARFFEHAREKTVPSEIIEIFLRDAEYADYLARNFSNIQEREENIAELARFATTFTDLSELLEKIALVQTTDTGELGIKNHESREGNERPIIHNSQFVIHPSVSLMTIHMAKGLEFDRVFVAGCAEGLVPHAWSLGSDAELEEERRLMYVAMTRARQELTLTYYGAPSRFLSEIPPMFTAAVSMVNEEDYITLE